MIKNPSVFAALIGVLGTLLGVTLGFFLNLFKVSGKLKIFVNELKIAYSERDSLGGVLSKDTLTPKSEYATIIFEVDIYNSSSEYRTMREIKLMIVEKGNKSVIKIRDNSTRRVAAYQIKVDDLKVITIAPKAIINLNLSGIVNENFKNLDNSEIFLQFKDYRQRNQVEKIKNYG